jgi:rfaE bifunctional protein nucleotidyltransferase chain/domain
MKTIWINGCFDVLHRGHIELFKYAKGLGGFVVVGIDSDERVKSLKGETRPINSEDDREFFLKSIKYIDKVIIFGSDDELRSVISLHSPDIMIVGSDYRNKIVIGSELSKRLVFFDRIGDYSTTNILKNHSEGKYEN